MANKKLCRFCSTGFVPQRNEKICPTCSMEVSRAVSLPVGEPVIIESPQIKVIIPSDVDAEIKITEKEVIEVPEPEVTAEDLEEELSKNETVPVPEPEVSVVVEAAAPKSAEENRKQDAEVINPTED